MIHWFCLFLFQKIQLVGKFKLHFSWFLFSSSFSISSELFRKTADPALHLAGIAALDGVLTTEKVANDVIENLRNSALNNKQEFLILPHKVVREYIARKGQDMDRWISGMRKLQQRLYHSNKVSKL
jgi:hypothetical protein